jgi:hypothetical protein
MSAFGGKADMAIALQMSALDPKRTFGWECDSKDETGEPMHYFQASDGKPERIGKVIGDTLAALVILAVPMYSAEDTVEKLQLLGAAIGLFAAGTLMVLYENFRIKAGLLF